MYIGFFELMVPVLRSAVVLLGTMWLVWSIQSGAPPAAGFLVGPVLALVALIAYRLVDRRPWEEFGLGFLRDPRRVFHWSLLPVLATYILFLSIACLAGLELTPYGLSAIVKQVGMVSLTVLGMEFFFRGYLFRTMDLYGLWYGLVMSSLLYGLAQPVLFPGQPLSLLTLAQAVTAGVLFGFLFYRTGSLWPSILLHALFRLPESLLHIAPSAAVLLTWFALAVQVATLILLHRILQVTPEEQQPLVEDPTPEKGTD